MISVNKAESDSKVFDSRELLVFAITHCISNIGIATLGR